MGLGREAGEVKYFPPNFDPSTVPRLPPQDRNAPSTVRMMMPMGVQCNACGDWIAEGKKFNSKKQKVLSESYLGLPIWRLTVKCPRCCNNISIKTDPQNFDYTIESGAQRLYQHHRAEKVKADAAEQAEKEKEGDMLAQQNQKVEQAQREMRELERLEQLQYDKADKAELSMDDVLTSSRTKHLHQQRLDEEADAREAEAAFRRREREQQARAEQECRKVADSAELGASLSAAADADDPPGVAPAAVQRKRRRRPQADDKKRKRPAPAAAAAATPGLLGLGTYGSGSGSEG
eukprot:TRINITY_DN16144_c1_g1_i1.p1 TRINITY_DN16144_c1_g1~~TRINITY_DN16144_c1_g1_i1.p1  ORF type:complete len:291 (+),score=90.30 TRINITY_DN16144_c1_g1_i1:96-968(+)